MKRKLIFLIWLCVISTALHAQSGPIHLRVSDYGFLTSFPALQTILDNYLNTVEADLNKQQPIVDPYRVIKSTGDATALASRGVGVDYASRINKFIVGASLGAAGDLQEDKGLRDLPAGVGGAAGLMFGTNIAQKTDLFFSVGGLSHSRQFDGILNTKLDSEITTFNASVHLRYNLVKGSGDEQFGWNGINLVTGYEYNKNELFFEDTLAEDINVDLGGGQGVLQGRVKGKPHYTIHSETHSIPLEASSAVTFLKFFSIFGGVGADMNFGYSHGSGHLSADAFSPLQCVSGACTNLNLPQVQAYANIDSRKNVSPVFYRLFGGLQLNVSHVRIYGEVNKIPDSHFLGVTTGIRLAF